MDDFTGADFSAAISASSDPATPAPETVSTTPTTTATEPAAQPGAATTQPAATPIPAKPTGPIPFDVHKTALDNARTKAVEEYKAKHGWAETLSKADYDQAVALAKRASTDRIAFIREYIADMQSDPVLAAQLRSEAARTLAAGRAAPTMPEPDVTITDEHGTAIGRTYSADGLAKRDAWLESQFMAKVNEQIAPLVKTHQTLEAQRQQAHDEAEGAKFATTLYSELKDYPHFEANKKAIGAEVVSLLQQYGDDPRTNEPAFLEAVTLRAYHRVVTTKQDALSRQAAVHDLTTKAGNSGAVPGRAPVGAPKRSDDGRFTAADIAAEFSRRRMG